MTNIKNMR